MLGSALLAGSITNNSEAKTKETTNSIFHVTLMEAKESPKPLPTEYNAVDYWQVPVERLEDTDSDCNVLADQRQEEAKEIGIDAIYYCTVKSSNNFYQK